MDAATDWVSDTGAGGVRALDFDGSNDTVVTTGYTAAPGTSNFSASFWVYKRATGDIGDWLSNRIVGANGFQAGFVIGKSGNTTSRIFNVLFDAAGGVFRVNTYNTFYTLNTWHHIVVVWTNSTGLIVVYRDGSAVTESSTLTGGTIAGATIGSTGDLRLCGRPAVASGRTPNALFDDWRLFSQALTATEVTALYNAGRGRGIVAASNFNGGFAELSGGFQN